MSEIAKYGRQLPIGRVHSCASKTLDQTYLLDASKPVIVTDALNNWKALSKWSFDFFKTHYGSDYVVPSVWPGNKWVKIMSLGDYIEYLEKPCAGSPGFWVDPTTRFPLDRPPEPPSMPLYLAGWRTFNLHPELLEDIELSPKFVEDWLPLLPEAFRRVLRESTRYFPAGVLIGPAGSVAMLHQDFLHTHAYLAQILGRKRCVLFSPDDSAALYDGRVDPDRPDLEEFPLFRNATAFECTLEPGELLFIPSRWWHYVIAIEKSMTVNYNFFNRANFNGHLTDLLRDLPAIVNGIQKSPSAAADLGIRWECKGFDFRDSGRVGDL